MSSHSMKMEKKGLRLFAGRIKKLKAPVPGSPKKLSTAYWPLEYRVVKHLSGAGGSALSLTKSIFQKLQ